MTTDTLGRARLEPCPFCGSDEGLTVGETVCSPLVYWWSVECHGCNVSNTANSEAEAITAWNTRALTREPSEADVERVARALVPVLAGGQEDTFGLPMPDKKFDDLSPDWQEAHRRYARAAIAAMAPGSGGMGE